MPLHPNVRRGLALLWVACAASPVSAQRSLGLDVSAYQDNLTDANWATLHRATNQTVGGIAGDGRDFVYLRSSRGGTTGEDHRQGGYVAPNNTQYALSQRYDDPYFAQNITRATNAGLFAGSYHFSRPDVIATTANAGGIANTGADEADHFIQMAGAWMRPGYLMPTHDLEAGEGIRTPNAMAQFAIDFSDRIYSVMGIRPAVYINGNYAGIVGSATSPTPASVVAAYPTLWIARWPNNSNPNAIDVQNAQPNTSLSSLYGPWDDAGNSQPWSFWQYASTARLNGVSNGSVSVDVDVANGGTEYLKDKLVPALLVADTASQNWSTLAAWNSGQTPLAPVISAGQLARVGTLTLPAVRLPTGNDTVILDRPSAAVVVTLDSGTHNIRKLFVRETLNLAGGSLTINCAPSADSTPISAQFSAPVTMSGTAALTVHTLQVDATRTFTLLGGSLTYNTINLMPQATTPAKITIAGNISLAGLNGATATIANGAGTGLTGWVDLGTMARTLTVSDGAAVTDVAINVPLRNGGITKAGPGALRLAGANTYIGTTTVDAGTLVLSVAAGAQQPVLGGVNVATPGGADVHGGRLVFDYVNTTTPATAVKNALAASYGTGFATGLLRSSGIDADHALGWLDNTAAGTLSVARTLYGDANLDLAVDFDDLLILAQNYGVTPGTGVWKTGDFNYDANVDFDDLLALAQHYGGAGLDATFAADWALAQSLVPEPTGLLAIAGLLGLRRRRRST